MAGADNNTGMPRIRDASDHGRDHSASTVDFSSTDQNCLRELHSLELELEQTRREAEAARLDAKAAELEIRIRQLKQQLGFDSTVAATENAHAITQCKQSVVSDDIRIDTSALVAGSDVPNQGTPDQRVSNSGFANVPEVEASPPRRTRKAKSSARSSNVAHPSVAVETESNQSARTEIETSDEVGKCDSVALGRGAETVSPERLRDLEELRGRLRTNRAESIVRIDAADPPSISDPDPKSRPSRVEVELACGETADDSESLVAESVPTADRSRPRRRAPVIYSALFHVAVLVLLAIVTLSSDTPRDQIAIAGAIVDAEQSTLESLQIEAPEAPASLSESEPEETPTDVGEFEAIPVNDLISDMPALPSPSAPAVPSVVSAATADSMAMTSESDVSMQFCGVEGGGNHFVYLVDSSGSMGEAFESARAELLRSIDHLQSSQRFYVIFFDAESDYMRLASPERDEPRSLYATNENKQALRRWATTISKDRGRAPYEALEFAIGLRPDVVFLLSDGEFPERIEELLRGINRVENLFGDSGPISIVHTIGYYSREGEQRMRRIAEQNGGMYRHVPKP